MPKLLVDTVPVGYRELQHWVTLIDAIIGPNSEKFDMKSSVPGTLPGKLVAVFDSGFSLPRVPKPIGDALYSNIPGAMLGSNPKVWGFSCKNEVNLTLSLGHELFCPSF